MRAACAIIIAIAGATALVAQPPQPPTAQTTPGKVPTVLFMCPHGAAKSLLASAYFQKLAKERGLNARVDSAGTEPDPQLSKGVVAHLQKNGYTIPIEKPRGATAADMNNVDVVVSMGCDLSKLPPPKGALKNWNVPDFSADFNVAEQSIRDQVVKLVDELVAAQKVRK